MQEADRATAAIKQSVTNLAEARLRQAPPKPAAACEDAAAAAAAQSAAAMFFQEPEQLEEILADLEEQNLFLIQNTQEAEEALDAVEANYKCAARRPAGLPSMLPASVSRDAVRDPVYLVKFVVHSASI